MFTWVFQFLWIYTLYVVYQHHRKKILHLAEVHQVIIKYNIHRPWQLPSRSLLWHLLDAQCLVITVDRQTELCFQRIAILILAQGKK